MIPRAGECIDDTPGLDIMQISASADRKRS